ncbi:hypothetical protein Hanom_Chr15g01363731 [Helianthus anomalus]
MEMVVVEWVCVVGQSRSSPECGSGRQKITREMRLGLMDAGGCCFVCVCNV